MTADIESEVYNVSSVGPSFKEKRFASLFIIGSALSIVYISILFASPCGHVIIFTRGDKILYLNLNIYIGFY